MCPEELPLPGPGSCYAVHRQGHENWSTAMQKCREMHIAAHLIVLDSASESDYMIHTLIGNSKYAGIMDQLYH